MTDIHTARQVLVVGTGKLATELLRDMAVGSTCRLAPWAARRLDAKAIVVHAGSGRELDAVAAFCAVTGSPLLELATGSVLEGRTHGFPVVLCPNTNILMLKVMCMLECSGHLFQGHPIRFTESHQSAKQSVPGTAVGMAQSLGLAAGEVRSVRSPQVQREELTIPERDLDRHAVHRIEIGDETCSVRLETRVFGDAPYAAGVGQIVAAAVGHTLENRVYPVAEFVRNGWI